MLWYNPLKIIKKIPDPWFECLIGIVGVFAEALLFKFFLTAADIAWQKIIIETILLIIKLFISMSG
jgi:hypothetical protein